MWAEVSMRAAVNMRADVWTFDACVVLEGHLPRCLYLQSGQIGIGRGDGEVGRFWKVDDEENRWAQETGREVEPEQFCRVQTVFAVAAPNIPRVGGSRWR
jgi:hypothetical protein